MDRTKTRAAALVAAALIGWPQSGEAVVAVIDRVAIANLVRQVDYWQRQIGFMTQQLEQLRSTHASMTGDRGMNRLLPMSPIQRNYLPADYAQLMATVQGNSPGYAGVGAQVRRAIEANAVLSNAQLAALDPESRRAIESGRRAAATIASFSRIAYENTSRRFAALQQLIDVIAAAGDTKAILDLQGRLGAEQAMLTNEQTKLQTLYQMLQAEQWQREQQVRERSISDVGSVKSLQSIRY